MPGRSLGSNGIMKAERPQSHFESDLSTQMEAAESVRKSPKANSRKRRSYIGGLVVAL